MTWKRVETGNPFKHGSVVGDEFMRLCRQYAPQMFNHVREIVENKDEYGATRLNAMKFIRETGYGKPRQAVELNLEPDIPPEMMTSEQLRLAAAAQTRELVLNLIESGQLDEYTRGYERVVPRIEKDITEVKDDHLGDKPKPKKSRGKK